jgi:ABC-type amino acid transport substrate-binding protein
MKTSTCISKLFGLVWVATAFTHGAYAQDEQSQKGLRIATGPGSGVYVQIAKDMQKVCGQSVPLVLVPSKGGLDNLTLLSSSQADVGFSQVDVLEQMSKEGDQNIQELQAVMAMHSNLLHVITRLDGSRINQTKVPLSQAYVPYSGEFRVLQKFSDLNIKGIKVVLVGSAALLGQTLERQLGYGMTFLQADSDEQAITLLRSKQADAIFTTGGWPYPAVSKLRRESGLMLAEFDLQAPAPFATTRKNYPELDAMKKNFLTSTNLFLTRPFKPNGERGKQVAALRKCILNNFDELKEGAYSSVWKEIKTPFETFGVAQFGRADSVAGSTAAAPKAVSKQFSKQEN